MHREIKEGEVDLGALNSSVSRWKSQAKINKRKITLITDTISIFLHVQTNTIFSTAKI